MHIDRIAEVGDCGKRVFGGVKRKGMNAGEVKSKSRTRQTIRRKRIGLASIRVPILDLNRVSLPMAVEGNDTLDSVYCVLSITKVNGVAAGPAIDNGVGHTSRTQDND